MNGTTKRIWRKMMNQRKSDLVRQLVERGLFKAALRIAKDFRIGITAAEREQMSRAYECMVHPEFYEAIGKNLETEILAGIEILKRHYGKEAAA